MDRFYLSDAVFNPSIVIDMADKNNRQQDHLTKNNQYAIGIFLPHKINTVNDL
ncbi:hypothetical protein [Paraburkholderia bryophila]|uniref:Uncharacterized protein n=1 Tax=Paraburkholderia bryophila TaxID=420952 RepID=A0A7Y9W6L8_9BURK|nr:hypothetical protein [Paraburkholderia bryophila]NYH15160.1 hypothetical protein [Paraburkholderia bryophila]NYH26528.1 hypothetical protein [Paraburkholderia bryophila]